MSSSLGNAGDREPTSPSNASTSCLKLFQGTCIGSSVTLPGPLFPSCLVLLMKEHLLPHSSAPRQAGPVTLRP